MIAVVLLLLTATALAHGALLVARAELSASRAYARALEEASLLRVRMDTALEAGLDPQMARMPHWTVTELAEPTGEASGPLLLRRLGPESWWLEGTAMDRRSRRIGTPGRLLWWLDPATRVRSLGAVVTVGRDAPVQLDGPIERSGFGRVEPPFDAATCEAEAGAGFQGVVPDAVAVAAGDASTRLGLLSFEDLWSGTSVEVTGTGAPSPTEWAGACSIHDPWNWGDPDRPAAPCGLHLAVRRSAETLHLAGGSGQAMLVIDGDLVLSGDMRLYGMVVASGGVTLLDRSELHGMALAEGGLRVAADAMVRGSACWAARALRAGVTTWMPFPARVPGLLPVAP